MNLLISIPISHYCDKVRWALELASLSYKEVFHIQVFSWFPALVATGFKSRYLPVLKTTHGVFTDSSDALKHINSIAVTSNILYPESHIDREEVEKLEDYFDDVFGPATRLWCYCQLFRHKDIVVKYNCYKTPRIQKWLMPMIFSALVKIGKKILTINNDSYLKSINTIEESLLKVEDLISDGREFLIGDKISAADIAFAAMMAPLIMPKNYGVPVPRIDEFDEEAQKAMKNYLNRPSGQFALQLYEKYRIPK